MQKFSANPREIVASFYRNKGLIKNLVYREIVGRYKGSIFGILWSLITPVLLLIVYTFVFSFVFNARWNDQNDSKTEFALVLFGGLLVFNVFAECINRAPGLVLANVNYVKKVVFPLEILPWVSMGSALFHFAVGFTVWLVAYIFLVGMPHWTVILSPLVLVPFILFVLGLSWALASLGVFLRDIGQLISILVQVLMFMTPVFYPASALPERFQTLAFLNPITPSIEMMRDVMYWGRVPEIQLWSIATLVSIATTLIGFIWFQKTRKGFADVI